EYCGDGVDNNNDMEECDDGAANSDTVPDACRTNCVLPICGDNVIDSMEQCEVDGDCRAEETCDTSCRCLSAATCGNGVIDPGEVCDGTDWGDITSCTDFGSFTGGMLFCDTRCLFDTSACTGGTTGFCGDGIVNVGETCDGENWGHILQCTIFDHFTNGELFCDSDCHFNTANCTPPTCGDGIIHPTLNEECDDGNLISGDGCSALCIEEHSSSSSSSSFISSSSVSSQILCGVGCEQLTQEECTAQHSEWSWANGGIVQSLQGRSIFTRFLKFIASIVLPTENRKNDMLAQSDTIGCCCPPEQSSSSSSSSLISSSSSTSSSTSSSSSISSSSSSSSSSIAPVCGNSIVETGEECDDGNTEMDDGCSDTCALEDGFVCGEAETSPDGPSICTPIYPGLPKSTCGNGIIQGSEKCDDGNITKDDGCSDSCTVEDGFECTVEDNHPDGPSICNPIIPDIPTAICGNGTQELGEECDDGNLANGDGCTSSCTEEPYERECGNGVLEGMEECDDGNNTNDDGCRSDCRIEREICGDYMVIGNEDCEPPGTAYCDSNCRVRQDVSVPDNGGRRSVNYCGDGIMHRNEQCEYNWQCITGEVCIHCACRDPLEVSQFTSCGNGTLEGAEECEADWQCLSNQCSACRCIGEPTHSAPEEEVIEPEPSHPSPVTPIPVVPQESPQQACGNGIQEASEECDDGNVLPGDGCSPTCTTEVVAGPSCGNGIVELYEQCDDGNSNSGDGCSPTCFIEITQVAQREAFCGDNVLDSSEECEQDWHCSSNKCVACRCENSFICGNGIPEGNEECDDGNLIPGDGCSINCTVENAQTTSSTPQQPQQSPIATIMPIAQTHPPAGSTGPAALVIIISGAAAGAGWMRKKRRHKTESV
ncbi:MAG: DUF4215 domain-containing protein, partial [Candidatus Peribacteraceae bacterium]